MSPRSEPDDPHGRWTPTVDDVGAFALVWGFVLVVTAPAFDFLLWGPGSDPRGLTAALGLLVALTVAAVVVVSEFRDPLDSLLEPTVPGDETVWDEIVLFGFTVFVVGVVVASSTNYVVALAPVAGLVAIGVRHALVIGGPLCLLGLRRRGRLSYPGWIQTDEWGLTDYGALFASTFLLCLAVVRSDYTFLLFLTEGVGVLVATVAVALRRTGALVPEDGTGPDRRDEDDAPTGYGAETEPDTTGGP